MQSSAAIFRRPMHSLCSGPDHCATRSSAAVIGGWPSFRVSRRARPAHRLAVPSTHAALSLWISAGRASRAPRPMMAVLPHVYEAVRSASGPRDNRRDHPPPPHPWCIPAMGPVRRISVAALRNPDTIATFRSSPATRPGRGRLREARALALVREERHAKHLSTPSEPAFVSAFAGNSEKAAPAHGVGRIGAQGNAHHRLTYACFPQAGMI
jgi:hypothetical protein